jgi:transposase
MEPYVGLDVSLKLTAICIMDQTGKIEREGMVASNPEAIAAFIKSYAPHVARVGLETGATATWLWTELNKMGLPIIRIDARHAKAALKMQINKSDRNDAVGIARIMQCGWYKEVRVKDLDSHAIKALLVSRALLVKIKRDLENQIRGLLKNLGLVIGRAKMNVFALRAAELTEDRPELAGAVEPLLKANGLFPGTHWIHFEPQLTAITMPTGSPITGRGTGPAPALSGLLWQRGGASRRGARSCT